MKADAWAKELLANVRSYHGGTEAVKRALKFLIEGKKDDTDAELEAAELERLKAANDRKMGAIGLANLREEHAGYLEVQAKRLKEQAKALEALLKKTKK